MQTIWFGPSGYVTGDPSLRISYAYVSHPGTVVTCKSPGDFKWVSMSLPFPPDREIEEIVVCYRALNANHQTPPQSFISQIRLVEMRSPDKVTVFHDHVPDQQNTNPTCHSSKVGGKVPNGAVTLELRLNFQNISDQIMLGAVGVTSRPIVVVPSYAQAQLPTMGAAGSIARVIDHVRGLWMDQGSHWFSLNGGTINVQEFGAKGDTTWLMNLTITAGASTLTTIATWQFGKHDEGKTIAIAGAGKDGASLTTTILSVIDATTIKLATQATTTISGTAAYFGTNDTAAIQRALNPSRGGAAVFIPPGNYLISASLKIPHGNIRLFGAGPSSQLVGAVIKPSTGIGMIEADYAGGTQQSNIELEDFALVGGLDSANCFRRGIKFKNITKSFVRKVQVSGVTANETASADDAFGICFADSTTMCTAEGNIIHMGSRGDSDHFNVGIIFQSDMAEGDNGRKLGQRPLLQTNIGNSIINNIVRGGTHGLCLQNTADTIISGNAVHDIMYRCIILYADNIRVTITNNILRNAGSTNIAADYGNKFVTVIGNICDTTTGNENNNIELYMDNSNVTISGNSLSNAGRYGIYLGYKATNFNITGNTITNCGRAGISITGSMASGYFNAEDELKTGGVERISITGNVIESCTFGIYVEGVSVESLEFDKKVPPNEFIKRSVYVKDVFIDQNCCLDGTFGILLMKSGTNAEFAPKVGRYNRISGQSNLDIDSDYPLLRVTDGTEIPTSGFWEVGSIVWNAGAIPGQPIGWQCTAGGRPGSWKPIHALG